MQIKLIRNRHDSSMIDMVTQQGKYVMLMASVHEDCFTDEISTELNKHNDAAIDVNMELEED